MIELSHTMRLQVDLLFIQNSKEDGDSPEIRQNSKGQELECDAQVVEPDLYLTLGPESAGGGELKKLQSALTLTLLT